VLALVAIALIHAAKPAVISTQKIGEDTVTVSRQDVGEGEVQILWRRLGPGHPDERRILYRGPCELGDTELGVRGCRVTANRFEIRQVDRYTSWWWRFQLSPLLLVEQGAGRQQGASGVDQPLPHFKASWDWQNVTGGGQTIEIHRNRCVKGATESPYDVERPFLSVPMISTPEAYRKDGWKSVPLGSCGLEVGGARSAGFVLQGERKKEAVAPAFKAVLLSEKELLVEVYDVGGVGSASAGNWLYADHLEVWMGFEELEADQESFDAHQWGIRLSDGTVFPAFGKPREPLKVERVARQATGGREAVAFKITLPSKGVPQALAVSYSKGSEGKKVEYLLGTSALCFGAGETLGVVTILPKRFGRCEVQKGALDLSPALPPPGDQPLITERDLLG